MSHHRGFIVVVVLLVAAGVARAAGVPDLSRYEGRTVAGVELVLEGVPRDAGAEAELAALLTVAPNTPFAATRVRESLQALFDSGRVANARVEAAEAGGALRLRFVVRPAVRVGDVLLNVTGAPPANPVSTDELRARLNLLQPGARVSEQALRASADLIQSYLRDRGFFQADVTYAQAVEPSGMRANVTYNITLGPQARVEYFDIKITGFDPALLARVRQALKLQPGAPFTRSALGEDLNRLRQVLINQKYLAPQFKEPQVVRDAARDTMTVTLEGSVGPVVNVEIKGYEIGDKTAREILPVRREGSIDESAIIEGARRIRNRLQEDGYFFAAVAADCAVAGAPVAPGTPGSTVTSTPAPVTSNTPTPAANTSAGNATAPAAAATAPAAPPAPPGTVPLTPADAPALQNGLGDLGDAGGACALLDPEALSGRTVNITYNVELGRRFRLTDVRVINADTGGPARLTYDDLADDLRSETSGLLSILPFIGKAGRGYTSNDILTQDQRTVQARYRDLGYRRATVEVRRGVALDSEDLVITFAVHEGPLTRVAGVDVRGNQIYTTEQLRAEPCKAAADRGEACIVVNAPYARTLARTDADRVRALYARNGYADADVRVDVVELPKNAAGDEQVRLVYNVTEGGKVFINRIIINGNEGTTPDAHLHTRREAIRQSIPLKEGDVLRADDLAESERVLYETNAFRQVIIRTQPAGENASGFRTRDVIIDLEELKPRRQDFIFGFSTDGGPLGGYELQNANLRGRLQQGALRFRANRQHQLLRFEFFDPRFRQYGKAKFSPLAASLQYSRDVSVTRFFRSTIDRGSFGIVQRLDEKGKPIPVSCTEIDETKCEHLNEPSINRFTFNIESQRVLNQRARTILFVRYNYEDVRIFNTGSLLVEPILRPDKAVRLSRFGATITRDTRDRQFDPTRGEYLSSDYALALRQLGGNLSFGKLLLTYRRYYQLGGGGKTRVQTPGLFERRGEPTGVKGTVFAGGITLGLANVFNPRDRDGVPGISDVDRSLPISERFFSGGSTTLRGFDFEEAGPRRVICPGTTDFENGVQVCRPSILRDLKGHQVRLNPFTVPVGGNAMAVVNLEARVPLTRLFQVVPFYDGGNVFRNIGDIFKRSSTPAGATLEERNLRAQWTNTVGLGLRFRTPLGPLAVDYGFLLNPPSFEIPQFTGPPATLRLSRTQIHFRFGQTF
ncbi:MAG TPA: POTRA domain-containing protein [Pyrinomonadaceae bacterium]